MHVINKLKAMEISEVKTLFYNFGFFTIYFDNWKNLSYLLLIELLVVIMQAFRLRNFIVPNIFLLWRLHRKLRRESKEGENVENRAKKISLLSWVNGFPFSPNFHRNFLYCHFLWVNIHIGFISEPLFIR